MARPYSMDLRERLVAAVEGVESRRSAARRFGVSAYGCGDPQRSGALPEDGLLRREKALSAGQQTE